MKSIIRLAIGLVVAGMALPACGEVLVYKLTEKDLALFERTGGQWWTGKEQETGYLVIDVDFGPPATFNSATILWYGTDENKNKIYEVVELEDNLELVVAAADNGTSYWIIRLDIAGRMKLMLDGKVKATDIGTDQKEELAKGLKGNNIRDETDDGDREIARSVYTAKLDAKRTKAYNDPEGDNPQDFDAAVAAVETDLQDSGYTEDV